MKSLSKFKLISFVLIALSLILCACGGAAESSAGNSASVKIESASAENTESKSSDSSAADVESDAAKADANEPASDINKNDTGKTVIKAISLDPAYPNNSYMILSKSGTVIVADPNTVIDGIKPDVITSTHGHPDHNDKAFYSKHQECKTSLYTPEDFKVKDVHIFSIPSTHISGKEVTKTDRSNVIYVYEVDGLRIAHMGDIAQEQLTAEQLKALGKIDIAFMQFVNSYSGYSLENEKGFKLIEQLKPQIIIPTHSSPEAAEKISSIVGTQETVENVFAVSKDDLKDGTRKVIEIKNTLRK